MSGTLIDDDQAFRFLDALQEEYSLYQQLLQMGLEQKRHIEAADEAQLFELMSRKQDVIVKIERIAKDHQEQRRLLESTPMGAFSSIDEQFDRVLQEIEKALKQLIENESGDMNLLKDFMATGSQRVKQLGQGKQMARAYLKPKSGSAMNRKV